MTALDIRPGQRYVRRITDGVRRVIEVTGVGERHVQTIGWLEDSTNDRWAVRPGSHRRTRVAISTTFRVLYRRLGAGQ